MIALQRNWIWTALAALAMIFSACVPLTPGAPGGPTATPIPPPTAGPGADEVVVDRIEIVILESFPVQVHVVVYGQLPDACSFVQEATQARQDNTFDVELVVARRPDARCAPQPTPFQHTIPLEVRGLKAGTYTVNVHGATGTFKLETDNVLPAEGLIGGRVWHDLCAVGGGEGGAPVAPSEGCVADPSGGFRANGVPEPGEPGIAGVVVTLGASECPSTGLAEAITGADGAYQFDALPAGTYCVAVDPLREPNTSILIPGGWTAPGVEEGRITVTLGPGEIRRDIHFGWDYQFLPPDPPAAFGIVLAQALMTRDEALLRQLMHDPFTVASWRSEGVSYTPDAAVEQLFGNDLGPGTQITFVEGEDLRALLGGMDPLSVFGPEAGIVRVLYAEGWGLEGRDEALLFIAREPGGRYSWYGVLVAPGGFAREPPPSSAEVALTWRREGGIAGFCDGLIVYQTGEALATSCKGIAPGGQVEGQLAGERLQQLADWIGKFESLDVVQKDDATADAMVVQVVFYGQGTTKATEADVQAIREFAAQVFQELTSPQGLGGPGVLATFDVDGEQFRVWVTNPHTIQQILELEQGKSMANIPNGRILRGPGYQDHNAPWSWPGPSSRWRCAAGGPRTWRNTSTNL